VFVVIGSSGKATIYLDNVCTVYPYGMLNDPLPQEWGCTMITDNSVINTGSMMWSETVGLRTRLVWDQKIGLGLVHCGLGLGFAGLMLCCKTRSCHARRHNDLEVLFIVSLFCAWNITTVEINSGVYLLKSETRQVPVFTSGDFGLGLVSSRLGLVILVLVLRIRSCLHHWSGLGLR